MQHSRELQLAVFVCTENELLSVIRISSWSIMALSPHRLCHADKAVDDKELQLKSNAVASKCNEKL